MTKLFYIFIFLVGSFWVNAQKQFGNEWLSDSKEMYEITISEKGIYRITYEDLKKASFPVDEVAMKNIQLFHHGKEVPFLLIGEADGVFNQQDYIEFYAEANNGELDSLLYRPQSARMNPYHSLYANETFYYLKLGSTAKRTKVLDSNGFRADLKELYHQETQVKAFNEQYSFNNTIGYPPFVMQSYYEVGEGWSGKVIVSDSLAKFPIKLLNYLPQKDFTPVLECLFNGRSEVVHDVTIGLQDNQNQLRAIGKIDYYGFAPLKIITKINENEISSDGQIQLRSRSSKKDNLEWHSLTYHKITYPQSFDMLGSPSKYFYLPTKSISKYHIAVINTPPDAVVYQLYDRYNFNKIEPISYSNQLNFTVENSGLPNSIFVSAEIKKVSQIRKINVNVDYSKVANFIIITHPILEQGAKEFANYRGSAVGGNFQTNVVKINDLYTNFSYGERTPIAIRRFIDYQLSRCSKIDYLFLIGRGKSFPDALKTDVALDMIPTMGYPGSDILLTAGLSNFDVDVQAVPTGRLSVISNNEILGYLQKIKEYEQNTDDLLWKKDILHLSGGANKTEIKYFKDMLKNIETKVQKGALAGKIESFSKQTDNSLENIDISQQLNRGVGLVTFIGHASATTTDLNIGFVSGLNSKFQNKIKYPLMFFNGCGVGNLFNKYDLLTTDWLLTPDKGAIAIFANSFWSYDFPTSRYLSNLYEKLFEDEETVGESIGKIQQTVNAKIKNEGADLFMLSNIHQLILQGDPSVRVFPLKMPDYKIDKLFITSTNKSLPIAGNDSLILGVVASNFGKYLPNKVISVGLKAKYAGKQIDLKRSIPNIAYQDTLYFTVRNESSLQALEITIDPENLYVENNENNNSKLLAIDWTLIGKQLTVYPSDALPDRLNPVLDVYFDDKKIKQEAYVAANAQIKIVLTDENSLSSADTTSIVALIQFCETCSLQTINSKNIQFIQKGFNQIEAQYSLPNLKKGIYKLVVTGRDAQRNSVGNAYEMLFRVADKQSPSQLIVFPNPTNDFCNFQFQIIDSQKPKAGLIKIFDTMGHLIQEVVFSPKVGQNEVFIKLVNTSAGVYQYRAMVEWQQGTVETFNGTLVVK